MAIVANSGGVLGAGDEGRRTTTPEFALGTTMIGADGFAWIYVQANGAIAASQSDIALTTDGAFQASDGLGAYVATTAFADNEYGWIREAGYVASA